MADATAERAAPRGRPSSDGCSPRRKQGS
jgi:hypothetical protein